jgi:hypothetical protein
VCPPERPRRSTFHVPFHYSSKVNIIEHKRTHLVNRITRGALACFEKALRKSGRRMALAWWDLVGGNQRPRPASVGWEQGAVWGLMCTG